MYFSLFVVFEIFIIFSQSSKYLNAKVQKLKDLKSNLEDYCQHWGENLMENDWRQRQIEGEMVWRENHQGTL